MVPPEPRKTDSLSELLDIEEIDTDLYRGINENTASDYTTLFGGQVAAQALRAAALTVPEGRRPHSLHGYFLRPGRPDHHVILRVSRDRDGRSFSARHVVAVQNGEVIFSMSASFQTPKPGGSFEQERPPPAADPDHLGRSGWMKRFAPTLDLRVFPPVIEAPPGEVTLPARLWVKPREPVADDPLMRACVLTYISDVSSGFGDGVAVEVTRGGPSIDHAVWFHQDIPLDDWLYLDMWPLKAGGSRGLYAGSIRGRDGALGAMLTQEILLLDPGMRSAPRGQ